MAEEIKRLIWDKEGERFGETGTDRGVLFPKNEIGKYDMGVVWNGLTAVTSSPSGAENNDFWADNIKYMSLQSAEDYSFTIEAYSSPEEFDKCDGTDSLDKKGVLSVGQQDRTGFGFSWRTLIVNDTLKSNYGYKLHVVYNASASVSERPYTTVNDSPELLNFSWECSTIPIDIPGKKPAAHIEFDMSKANEVQRLAIESILWGYDGKPEELTESFNKFKFPENASWVSTWKTNPVPTLLTPAEFAAVLEVNADGIGG